MINKEQAKKEIRHELKEMLLGIKMMKLVVDSEDPEMGELMVDTIIEDLQKLRRPAAAVTAARKAMLSQPMAGKSDEEVVAAREKAVAALTEKGYTVINTLFTDEWYSKEAMQRRGVEQIPLCFLAKSLENMSLCHAAYFCKGWENARGCRIEHEAAKAYGLTIIYEEGEANA